MSKVLTVGVGADLARLFAERTSGSVVPLGVEALTAGGGLLARIEEAGSPELVVLGTAVPLDRAFALAGRVDVAAAVSVAVVIEDADADLWMAAMRAGVRDVLAEAARLPGDAPHVAQPLPPVHVFGVPVGEVQALHDAQCEAARTEVKGGKPRKVRQDQATLLTCIASFPATAAECAADPAKAAVWGGHVHARAGELVASQVGRVGFLASDAAGYITGQVISINGGMGG